MDKLVVERSIWIAAPRERVWQAVTNPDQLAQWFAPALPGAQMKLDDSGKLTVYLGEMGINLLTMETLTPSKELAMRGVPDRALTVAYKLADEKDGTLVTVAMSDFERLPEETRTDRIRLSSSAWENTLRNLNAYVGGEALPVPFAAVGPLFGYWREPLKRLGIERSIWIDAPRERVWQALVNPRQLQAWFSPTTEWQLSALELGGKFYVKNSETNGEMYVEVIEVLDEPHKLVTRALPEPPDSVVKIKTYTLNTENKGTRLILSIIGYEPESEETRWGHMEQDAFGLGMMLENTKAYIEGMALPFPIGF